MLRPGFLLAWLLPTVLALILILATLASGSNSTVKTYDIVIIGATPAGIMAAVAAARHSMQKRTILILERTGHIGGLPANGLGATDIATKGATGGLFLEFVQRIKHYYVRRYGAHSKQVADCKGGYHFEPKVAHKVFEWFLKSAGPNVKLLKMRQLDAEAKWVVQEHSPATRVLKIRVLNRITGKDEWYGGRYFIDATYEGDFIAAAGIPYHIGRESQACYNETGAGVIYKYWGGPEGTGTTHSGDNGIQAYNYRLTLTNKASKVHTIQKPGDYNRNEYLSLVDDIITGRYTGVKPKGYCPPPQHKAAHPGKEGEGKEAQESNYNAGGEGGGGGEGGQRKGGGGGGDGDSRKPSCKVPGQPKGIRRLANMVRIPNDKFDANNQHLAFISTDLPEENWPYPTSSWAWRDNFANRLRSYTLGLFYFAQNDAAVPQWYRDSVRSWGLATDEYEDNMYFPRQIYVREGRRLQSIYTFTSRDALPPSGKAKVHKHSVTSSHYALDSHAVRKREQGRVGLDGFVSYRTPRPYTVPYEVMVPAGPMTNVLAPVAVGGTHIGFSTLRMEPCWMALGQAAGVAASILVSSMHADGRPKAVADINVKDLQNDLLLQKAVLVYFKGIGKLPAKERNKRQWALLRKGQSP